jgi:molybdate transport system substrate-binding protein
MLWGMTTRRRTLVAAAMVAICGALPASASALTVFAATSLTGVLPTIDKRPKYNNAGSDALVKQIRNGAPADVFASANLALPTKLWKDGLCTKPVVFATNVLVVTAPKSNPGKITSVYSLAHGSRKTLVMGSATVPVGIYTRQALHKLGIFRATFAHNRVSNVANVGAVKSAVIGGADAGFVYYTDWLPDRARLRRFRISTSVQPPVRYGVCRVVRKGADVAGAKAFIRRLQGPAARSKLKRAGFGVSRRA